MSRPVRPWSGLMSAADLAAYEPAFGSQDRPVRGGTSPAVLVVDMIRNAVDSAYPAGYGKTGWPAVAATVQLLDTARQIGLPIYYTKSYPEPGYRPKRVERGRWRIDDHAPADPAMAPGDVVVDDLAPHPEDVVICKGINPAPSSGRGWRPISILTQWTR